MIIISIIFIWLLKLQLDMPVTVSCWHSSMQQRPWDLLWWFKSIASDCDKIPHRIYKITLVFSCTLLGKYKPSVSFHLFVHRPLKSWSSTTTRSSSAPLPTTAGCSWGRGWTRASPTPTIQPWVRLPTVNLLISHCLLYLCVYLSE